MGETYQMTYTCGNCKNRFSIDLIKGMIAKGNGGTCPNCGVRDGTQLVNFTPEYTQQRSASKDKRQLLTEPGKF